MTRPDMLWARSAQLGGAFGLLALVLGCGEKPPRPVQPSTCVAPPEAEVPVIALSNSDVCPRAAATDGGRWEAAAVFAADEKDTLPPSMRRLCRYTWVGCKTPNYSSLPSENLTYAADDPPVVEALAPADKAGLELATAARTRLVRSSDALIPLQASATISPVLVRVLDTSAEPPNGGGEIGLEASSHGFDMAWITRYLACPGGALKPCAARVVTDLALGRSGGRGARSDLAASLYKTVRAWKRDGQKAPLAVLIAAGWEPALERMIPWRKAAGDSSDALPYSKVNVEGASGLSPGGRAMFAAALYAACNGALVVTAAGNDPGYKSSPTGPMWPAGWEAIEAPSADACKSWFGGDVTSKWVESKSSYKPLLYSVGAVDDRDHPIVGTRWKGVPRLVAPGSLAAAYPDDPGDAGYSRVCARGEDVTSAFVCDRTEVRTGTSVAAAVTAAAAAVVWSTHPTWSGHDVMAAIISGGMSLGERPDYGFNLTGKETIVRVSMCGALAASCKGAAKGECPEKLSCSRPPAFARGSKPQPFVPVRPGSLDLTVEAAAGGFDSVLLCQGCTFYRKQRKKDGCELEGVLNPALFEGGRVTRVVEPALDLYDAYGRRLGYVEAQGFKPDHWDVSKEAQAVYTDAASCGGAVQAVVRFTVCLDTACSKKVPVLRDVPIVE
ncbi:MAG: S8 family serine peptidase [Polyangiaceae bacterium]|nr:S8 family serine peptidase [Polyangiaceae bacterium]